VAGVDWQGRDGHGLRVNWHGTAGLEGLGWPGVEWQARSGNASSGQVTKGKEWQVG